MKRYSKVQELDDRIENVSTEDLKDSLLHALAASRNRCIELEDYVPSNEIAKEITRDRLMMERRLYGRLLMILEKAESVVAKI